MNITAVRSNPRPEPFIKLINNTYSPYEILKQHGHLNTSFEDRGVLKLKLGKKSTWPSYESTGAQWVIETSQNNIQDPIATAATVDLDFSQAGGTPERNMSLNFKRAAAFRSDDSQTYVQADFELIMREIASSGIGIALRLQSMLTILASMAYYNDLPIFDEVNKVQQTRFVKAQIPVGNAEVYRDRPAGWTRGYILVLVFTIVHIVLMSIIIAMFFIRKLYPKYSILFVCFWLTDGLQKHRCQLSTMLGKPSLRCKYLKLKYIYKRPV